jgi:altronate hydrolase
MACVRIHARDNVAVALRDIAPGEPVSCSGITVQSLDAIPRLHKIALVAIDMGDAIVKYGYPIAHAAESIRPGEWVHMHNAKTNLSGTQDFDYSPASGSQTPNVQGLPTHFEGYVRSRKPDGSPEVVGIRNEIWIVPTVGCVNPIAKELIREFIARGGARGLDGAFPLLHPFGCSQLGDDHIATQRILASLVRHPNAGGVLILGLGCEENTEESFRAVLGEDAESERVRFLVCQRVEDEIATGLSLLDELASNARKYRRTSIPISALKIGMKCGGSDAFSGITANPLVGAFSDCLIAQGGTTVLTEVPEMFGAESVLLERCANRDVFDGAVRMVDRFRNYFLDHGQPIGENPSPGNRQGGITTLEEKSLGCVQKGGSATVVDVLEYGDRLRTPGLNLLDGPGNDIVSLTALAASGVHCVLFTTGRGTPLGGPIPTIKIATNSELARSKPHWIDFDAGPILEGVSVDDLARDLFHLVVDIASDKVPTRNETHDNREIAIWKNGVTL